MELTNLMQCIAQTFGIKTGEAIKAEITKVLNLENIDITTLNNRITTINNLLATTDTNGQATAQTIINTITALTTRISTLEGDTRVAAVQAAVETLTSGLEAEVTRAKAAEAALAAQIATINTSLAGLQAQIAAIPPDTTCDCAAITAALAAHSTQIANLQASDASQSAQIAALQSTVEGLTNSVAAAQAASAAASAQAASAANAAAAASAAAAAASAAVAALDTREDNHYRKHEADLEGKVSRVEVEGIDCAALGEMFAAGVRFGIDPSTY
jgi:chromosome segregation ATPase